MATYQHPITGVPLNIIQLKRRSLNSREAVTAWVMKLQGHSFTDTVQHFGTNANRLGEVFRKELFPNAHDEAIALLKKHKALLV